MKWLVEAKSPGAASNSPRLERAVIAAVLGAALVCAYYNPVFFDEVAYNLTLGRLTADGLHRIFLFPQCSSSFSNPVSADLLWPMQLIDLLYRPVHSLSSLRLLGALLAAANALLFNAIFSAMARPAERKYASRLTACLVAGVFPFLFVMARPEGLILFFVLCAIRLAQFAGSSPLSDGLALAGCLACGIIAFSIHPLGILLCPVFLTAIWFCRLAGRARLVAGAVLGWYLLRCYAFHSSYFSCSENKEINDYLNLYAGAAPGAGPLDWLLAKLHNLLFTPLLAIELIPHQDYRNGYVPAALSGANMAGAWIAGMLIVAAAVVLFWANLRFLRALLAGSRGSKWFAEMPFGAAVYFSVWASILIQAAIQPDKLPHRAIMLYPLLLLATGAGFFSFDSTKFTSRWPRLINFLACSAVVSALITIPLYLPAIAARQTDNLIADQPLSVGRLSAEVRAESIAQAASACGLANSPDFKRLALDSLTYYAFDRTTEPVIFGFFTPLDSSEAFARYLNQAKIGAVIASCRSFGGKLDLSPRRFGEICCLDANRIEELRAPARADPQKGQPPA